MSDACSCSRASSALTQPQSVPKTLRFPILNACGFLRVHSHEHHVVTYLRLSTFNLCDLSIDNGVRRQERFIEAPETSRVLLIVNDKDIAEKVGVVDVSEDTAEVGLVLHSHRLHHVALMVLLILRQAGVINPNPLLLRMLQEPLSNGLPLALDSRQGGTFLASDD